MKVGAPFYSGVLLLLLTLPACCKGGGGGGGGGGRPTAAKYEIAGPGGVTAALPAVYSALSFDLFSQNRFSGFWGDPAYGTFADPDNPPGVTGIYEGTDGDNVTLRLWFTGADFTGLAAGIKSYFGMVNVGQSDPCNRTNATIWTFWYWQDGGRVYTFKTVQIDSLGNWGFGPARGWNPSYSGMDLENKFDIVLEFVPASAPGELRVYGFMKRYYSTDNYHYAPGRWIPLHYAWGLTAEEAAMFPQVKDPTVLGPMNRYYNTFSGYPFATAMNVFVGLETGTDAGTVTWTQIRAEGTPNRSKPRKK